MGGAAAGFVAGETAVRICFNRRGDSLGGAAAIIDVPVDEKAPVSIAGAILWGVLPPIYGFGVG